MMLLLEMGKNHFFKMVLVIFRASIFDLLLMQSKPVEILLD